MPRNQGALRRRHFLEQPPRSTRLTLTATQKTTRLAPASRPLDAIPDVARSKSQEMNQDVRFKILRTIFMHSGSTILRQMDASHKENVSQKRSEHFKLRARS